MKLRHVATKKIIARGPAALACHIPLSWVKANKLSRGDKIITASDKDREYLFILVSGTSVKITTEYVYKLKEYNLCLQVNKHKQNANAYPLITLPKAYTEANELKAGDAVDIYLTEQIDCMVIKRKDIKNERK